MIFFKNSDYNAPDCLFIAQSNSMMNPKRILIVDIGSLLIGAMESVLKNNGTFAVVNVTPRDIETLVQAIERINPNVIVMDEDTPFIEPIRLFASLWNIRNIRVIVLSNRGIFVDIFDRHKCAISSPSQLIDAIQSDRIIPGVE